MHPYRFHQPVQEVPSKGTKNIRRWYGQYQALIRAIPRDGTSATTRRYDRYHRVKQTSVPGI